MHISIVDNRLRTSENKRVPLCSACRRHVVADLERVARAVRDGLANVLEARRHRLPCSRGRGLQIDALQAVFYLKKQERVERLWERKEREKKVGRESVCICALVYECVLKTYNVLD